MKYAALIMAVVFLASLLGTGWLYLSSTVTAEVVSAAAVEAATQPDYFSTLQKQIQAGTFQGTPFASSLDGSAEDYQFYTYTVRIANNTFLTADMIEIQVTPMSGDVLQVGDTTARALKAHTKGDMSATILTANGMHGVREMTVTWYVWGMPFSLKVRSGSN